MKSSEDIQDDKRTSTTGVEHIVHKHMEGENFMTLNEQIKNIDVRSLKTNIKMDEIMAELDWMLLNKKLGGSWENFEVLGFEIEDETLVKQFFAVILMFTGLFRLNEKIGI